MANKLLTVLLCLSILPVSAQLTNLEDTIPLNEVVFSVQRNNIDSRGLGNMRINMEQLKISPLFLGERDIIKTLQFLPGVSAGMEGSSQLNIRGGQTIRRYIYWTMSLYTIKAILLDYSRFLIQML